jgi:DNA-binding SARP family transcriptional activator
MAAWRRRRPQPPTPKSAAHKVDRFSYSPPLRECYTELAVRLDEIESQAVRQRERAIVPIISALRELCVAYSDCCVEIDQHDQARTASLERERDLRRDIRLVLKALTERDASGGFAGWGTLQAFFRRELDALELAAKEDPGLNAPSGPPRQVLSEPGSRPARRRATHSLAAYCLGSFNVYLDNLLVEAWNGHKAVSVLRYLLLHRKHRVPKDVLFELFWPGHEPEACRRNLHQAIYSLRHTLRRYRARVRYLVFEEDCYFLNPDIDVWIDAEAFSDCVDAGRRLEERRLTDNARAEYGRAVSLYHGHLFEECLYEDWAGVERERLRSEFRLAAGRLVDFYIDQAEHSAAIVLCQKALSLDRCDQDAHRRLMRCYEAQGQRHLALRQFSVCAEALRTDFSLAPDEATKALYDQLKSSTGGGR